MPVNKHKYYLIFVKRYLNRIQYHLKDFKENLIFSPILTKTV